MSIVSDHSLDRLGTEMRRLALLPRADRVCDALLLQSFIDRRDAAAFEALVRRHGPMVLGVCRRVLQNSHDADDAFQATFLVLVRKASSIVPRQLVGNWLYGVACRTAIKARAMSRKRTAKERPLDGVIEYATSPHPPVAEVNSILDEEVDRLSADYRAVVVLCDLQGRSRKQAAEALGLPEGTISSRLARARTMLKDRLRRRGLAIPGAALGALFAASEAGAAPPPPLVASVTQSATSLCANGSLATAVQSPTVLALTMGVRRTMFLVQLRRAAMFAAAAAIMAVTATAVGYRAMAPVRTVGGNGQVRALAFSPDGRVLATGRNLRQDGGITSEIVLWDTATWESKRVLPSDPSSVAALCFSPDATTLAVATNHIKLWRLGDLIRR